MGKRKKLSNANYDDTDVRKHVIKFSREYLGVSVKQNPKQRKIDLIGRKKNPDVGIEVEKGGWKGDFWDCPAYCDLPQLGFSTVNIPIRKEKYWKEYNMFYRKLRYNPGWNKNIFVRTNSDFSQVIVIRPEVITDSEKMIYTTFQANNCDEPEDWMSFRREDVETYNLIEGKYVLEPWD
jgi:hypothetical protein